MTSGPGSAWVPSEPEGAGAVSHHSPGEGMVLRAWELFVVRIL